MKNILTLVIGTLLSVGILCATTNAQSVNPSAQTTIASEGAWSMSSCIAGGFWRYRSPLIDSRRWLAYAELPSGHAGLQ